MSLAEKLTTIAENEQKVYEAGKQAEYDRFWDNAQINGTKTSYVYGFAGANWNAETFKPKYDMYITNGNGMFMYSAIKVDLVEHLKTLGIVLDFSKNVGVLNVFSYTDFIRVGVVDFSKASSSISTPFANSEFLETIDLMKLADSGTQTLTNPFTGCTALKNIKVSGVIGRNFQIQYSPLTVDSMKSIIEHLKDYKGSSSEYAYGVKFSETCWNALEETTPPEGYNTWKNYVDDLGWNV